MGTITTADGTEIYDKDWGEGRPRLFSHGWPLWADDWDTRLLFFLAHGYRVIAHEWACRAGNRRTLLWRGGPRRCGRRSHGGEIPFLPGGGTRKP